MKLDGRGLPVKIVNHGIDVDDTGMLRSTVKDEKTVGVEWIYRMPLVRESHLCIFVYEYVQRILARFHKDDGQHLGWGKDPFPFILKPGSNELMRNEELLPKVLGCKDYKIQRNYFNELKPWLNKQGISYVDLLEEMKRHKGRYYPVNGEVHFNPAGHRFTAEQIRYSLNQKKLGGSGI